MTDAEMPETITWVEPWRTRYPFRTPWQIVARMARMLGAMAKSRHVLIGLALGLPICGLCVWLSRDVLPLVDPWPTVWAAARVAMILLVSLLYFIYVATLFFHCWYRLFPPFVEVTRRGIRVPMYFLPYSQVVKIEIIENFRRTWLRYSTKHTTRQAAIAPGVDIQALRVLLDQRDHGSQLPAKLPPHPHEKGWLLMPGMILAALFFVVGIYGWVALLDLTLAALSHVLPSHLH